MTESLNRKALKRLIRLDRSFLRDDKSEYMTFLILYLFLYKYVSDNLKNYLQSKFSLPALHDIYADETLFENAKKEALNDLGYFIERPDAFMREIVRMDEIQYFEGWIDFSLENMVFDDEGFLNECSDVISQFNGVSRDKNRDLVIVEYIRLISKFSVDENAFTFQQVFDNVESLRMVGLRQTPDYITDILSKVVSSQKTGADDIYDPFLNDSAVLMKVAGGLDVNFIYGKEAEFLEYFYSNVRAIINGFKPSQIFFFNHNAINSLSIENRQFDVIVSKIPNSRYYSKQMLEPSGEYSDTSMELKKEILSKFEASDLKADDKVLDALDLLIDEVKAADSTQSIKFEGEYEALNDSEFLFIINMINSLKSDGLMAVSLSQNFLFKKSLALLRKFLTYENNYIDAIISVPEDLGRSIRPEVIIVFRKDKKTDDIMFIDISKQYTTKRVPNAVPGLLRRNLMLSDECTNKIIDIYAKREKIDKMSEVVSLKQIAGNDFNLSVSRYVDTFEGEFVQLSDLSDEKRDLTSKIKCLNEKIDEMMDELNIRL